MLQFSGHEQATAFAECLTEAVLREYDGLELFVKQMPYDSAGTPKENLENLSRELEKKKSLRKSGFRRLSFGMEKLDDESFSPAYAKEAPAKRDVDPAGRVGVSDGV